MPSAIIFNASAQAIDINVNGGAYFTIPPAAAPDWIPQSVAAEMSLTPAGLGIFSPGQNEISIMPPGATQAEATLVELYPQVAWNAVQIYYLRSSYGDDAVVVLNDGNFISQPNSQNGSLQGRG